MITLLLRFLVFPRAPWTLQPRLGPEILERQLKRLQLLSVTLRFFARQLRPWLLGNVGLPGSALLPRHRSLIFCFKQGSLGRDQWLHQRITATIAWASSGFPTSGFGQPLPGVQRARPQRFARNRLLVERRTFRPQSLEIAVFHESLFPRSIERLLAFRLFQLFEFEVGHLPNLDFALLS